jgi:hypothetical protein
LGGALVRGGAGPLGWCSLAVRSSGDPSVASGRSYGKRRRRGGALRAEPIERMKALVEVAVT